MSDERQSQPTTSTLHIRPQDSLSAVLERIRHEQAGAVKLVVPERAVVAQGSVALKLLADEAERMGKQVSVASESVQTRTLAKRAGLTVVGDEAATPEEHGFLPGTDVGEQAQNAKLKTQNEAAEGRGQKAEDGGVREVSWPAAGGALAAGVAGGAAGLKGRVMGWAKRVHMGWAAVGVVALFVIVGGGIFYLATYYLPQATVTLYAQERTIDRDLNVTADPNASQADPASLTVPATLLQATSTKTQTFNASGKKDVGTKAQGQVTVYNETNQAKTFPAGTALSASKLNFTLNSAVSVPAATTQVQIDPDTLKLTNVTTPGTATVTITAGDVGPDYNLDAKTSFAIGGMDQSSFVARNDQALSGGTKKTVTTVTSDDQSGAGDTLKQAAEADALNQLKGQVQSGQLFLDDAVKQQVGSLSFSQDVGDTADTFDGTVKVTASAAVVSQKDLQAMLTSAVTDKVPDGYTMDKNQTSIDNHVVSVDSDGTLHLTSTFKTQVVPQVDVNALKHAIAGKNPTAVQNYLKSQPNLSGYDIKLTPKLPWIFYRLPKLESHIQVKVEVKK